MKRECRRLTFDGRIPVVGFGKNQLACSAMAYPRIRTDHSGATFAYVPRNLHDYFDRPRFVFERRSPSGGRAAALIGADWTSRVRSVAWPLGAFLARNTCYWLDHARLGVPFLFGACSNDE